MKLRYYQDDLIKKINSNNITICEWPTAYGLDSTLDYYMDLNSELKFGFMGYLAVLECNYPNNQPTYIKFDMIYGVELDFLIIDYRNMFRRALKDVIAYCISQSIKIIIKKNHYDLIESLNDYNYVYSDASITKEIDRREKIKRLIKT